jgi:hypothetical protein
MDAAFRIYHRFQVHMSSRLVRLLLQPNRRFLAFQESQPWASRKVSQCTLPHPANSSIWVSAEGLGIASQLWTIEEVPKIPSKSGPYLSDLSSFHICIILEVSKYSLPFSTLFGTVDFIRRKTWEPETQPD